MNAPPDSSATEWAEAPDRIVDERVLLRALTEAQNQFILSDRPNEVFDGLLQILLKITKSEYGFIGEVLREEDGTPFLKTHAITNIAWNDETRRFYEENAPGGLEFRNLDTLFGRVMTTGERVISNDPDHDPRAGGRPPGHPPLRSFLGNPIYAGSQMVGMVGIANRPGGYDAHISGSLTPFLTTCGTLIRARATETAKVRAIEALRESERGARAVLDTAAEGIVTIDPKGIVQSYNASCERIFGYEAKEVIGQNVSMLMQKKERELHDGYLQRYAETGEKKIIGKGRELTARRKDGSIIPIYLAIGEVILDTQTYYTGMIYDLSELKQAQRRLQNQAQELQRSNEALESFAFVASHDLQEPVRKVLMLSDLLAKDCQSALPDDGARYLEQIQETALHMQRLVKDALRYSRVTFGDRSFADFDMTGVFRLVRENLAQAIEQAKASFHIDFQENLCGDETLIAQVLQNLVENALRFRRKNVEPIIIISTALSKDDASGNQFVHLTVQDNGCGFEQQYAEKIFQVFERLHFDSTSKGTGIGLAICRKIMEFHGGDISAHATLGAGATFVARFPTRD